MKTVVTNMGSTLQIEIQGHVTGVAEVLVLKDILDANADVSRIEFIINDAYVIPSMLIGILLKEVHSAKKKVMIRTTQERLKTLINELSLNTFIEVR